MSSTDCAMNAEMLSYLKGMEDRIVASNQEALRTELAKMKTEMLKEQKSAIEEAVNAVAVSVPLTSPHPSTNIVSPTKTVEEMRVQSADVAPQQECIVEPPSSASIPSQPSDQNALEADTEEAVEELAEGNAGEATEETFEVVQECPEEATEGSAEVPSEHIPVQIHSQEDVQTTEIAETSANAAPGDATATPNVVVTEEAVTLSEAAVIADHQTQATEGTDIATFGADWKSYREDDKTSISGDSDSPDREAEPSVDDEAGDGVASSTGVDSYTPITGSLSALSFEAPTVDHEMSDVVQTAIASFTTTGSQTSSAQQPLPVSFSKTTYVKEDVVMVDNSNAPRAEQPSSGSAPSTTTVAGDVMMGNSEDGRTANVFSSSSSAPQPDQAAMGAIPPMAPQPDQAALGVIPPTAPQPDPATLGPIPPTQATTNPVQATGDQDMTDSDVMLDLLLQARRQVASRPALVPPLFAGMIEFTFENSSDVEVIKRHFTSRVGFGRANRSSIAAKAIAKMTELVNDGTLSSSLLIMWICKEALVAQDQDLQPSVDFVTSHIESSRRMPPLLRLFGRISEANFELANENNPDGCLTWDQIKALARKEELACFDFKRLSCNFENLRLALRQKFTSDDSEKYAQAMTGKMRLWSEVKLRSEVTEQLTAGRSVRQLPRVPKRKFLECDRGRAETLSVKRGRCSKYKPNRGIHLFSFNAPDPHFS